MPHRSAYIASCVGLLVFGVVLTTVGAILPAVIDQFRLATAQAAALPLMLSTGILIGSILFGPIGDRWGYRPLLAACGVLIIAGLETIAAAPSFGWLRLGVLLIGIGGGALSGGTNALAADVSTEHRHARMALQGVFFGVGAVSMPFALGLLVGRVPPAPVLAVFGALVLVPLALLRMVRFPPPKHAHGLPLRQMLRLARDSTLLLYGAMLFFQSGVELTVASWAATYLEGELGHGSRFGLFFLALYWLGMTLSRLAWGTVLRRIAPARTLHVSIAVALLGAALLLGPSNAAGVWGGVFLLGAGFGAVFPTTLALIGERYAALSGSAFSIVLVIALSGGMALPYATGVLGSAYGLRTALLLVPAALCALALVFALVRRRERRLQVTRAPAATRGELPTGT